MQLHASSRLDDNDNVRLPAPSNAAAQEQRREKKNTKGARFASWFLAPRCLVTLMHYYTRPECILISFRLPEETWNYERIPCLFLWIAAVSGKIFPGEPPIATRNQNFRNGMREAMMKEIVRHIDICNIISRYNNGKRSLSFLLKFLRCSLEKSFNKLYLFITQGRTESQNLMSFDVTLIEPRL